jgi:hypothetical protein
MQDSYSDKEYKDMMKATLMQNTQEIDMESRSAIMKAITSGASTEEVHREIQMLTQNLQERAKQAQEMEAKMMQEKDAFQRELLAYQSELRVQEGLAISAGQETSKIEIEKIKASVFALQSDINKDMIADSTTETQMKIDADKEMQDKQIEADKELKEMDIDGKIKVEKAKPKPKVASK